MALTVQELISKLERMNPDAEVHITYDYGDHRHTQVAPVVHTVEQGLVEESVYHSIDKVVEETGGKNVRSVVLIG